MDFNDLLRLQGFDPATVIVLRHRTYEEQLNRVLPWLAAERHDLFNAYQQVQSVRLEASMGRASHLASFIGHAPGKALFVGLYAIGATERLTHDAFWARPAHQELQTYGYLGFTEVAAVKRPTALSFDLAPTPFYPAWRGRLVIGFPPPERSWWRRAHKGAFPIEAIHEDSALDAAMPPWNEIDLGWAELKALPTRWRNAMAQWRGVYLIFDTEDGKAYVGSAYGADNILGRWLNYSATGHGDNRLLRGRDPADFRFTILQTVPLDMPADAVIAAEANWKRRLHTAHPFGLNAN